MVSFYDRPDRLLIDLATGSYCGLSYSLCLRFGWNNCYGGVLSLLSGALELLDLIGDE